VTFTSPGGRLTILEAGRATLELADPTYAEFIDEVEVGHRVAGHIRVAFQVEDSAATTRAAEAAGAWLSLNPYGLPGTHSIRVSQRLPAFS
jgi:lactoylglutathione lyase